MDSAPAVMHWYCNVQRGLEECVLALKQELHGPEDPSISDSEAVGDGEFEHYGNCESPLGSKAYCKREITMGPVGRPSWRGAPNVTVFTTCSHILSGIC